MAQLSKKIKGFTLMETLVAGIIVSIISGLAMMTYLNLANVIESTEDILISEKATLELDSLSNIQGGFDISYTWGDVYQIVGNKISYDGTDDLYQLTVEVQDSTGYLITSKRKLVYEYKAQ